MKNTVLVSLLALGLAACGGGSGGDRAKLVEACTNDGTDAETCECMADAARENLDDNLYEVLVEAATGGDEADAEAMLSELSPAQQTQFMGFMMTAATSCALTE